MNQVENRIIWNIKLNPRRQIPIHLKSNIIKILIKIPIQTKSSSRQSSCKSADTNAFLQYDDDDAISLSYLHLDLGDGIYYITTENLFAGGTAYG